jgi:adenylate cyclase
MTILFCDVRGFTSISEYFDAENLAGLVNRLLTPLSDIIVAGEGTVDKYMGDCVMAFWNAPLDNPEHARDSCLTALKIVSAMAPLNERLKKDAKAEGRPYFRLKVGLGLNSGEVVVGNMGSAQRMNYSVLGDTVNTASRLEAQSKTYGVDIVIGPNTQARVEDLATIELDLIRVKGKTEVLKIYALIGDDAFAVGRRFLAVKESHGLMLQAYRNMDWAKARDLINATRRLGARFDLDALYDLYESRINAFRADPPAADWDGVFNAASK